MKILLDCQIPVSLAHGGAQIQIDRTKEALEREGCEVEYLRWWDLEQTGDIIHFFGRANPSMITLAHAKGIKYVMSDLLTGQGSRKAWQLQAQGLIEKLLRKIMPPVFLSNFRWDAYTQSDAVIVLTAWEAKIVSMLFGTQKDRLHVVPNGVEPEFFRKPGESSERGDELVCTATITERKRVLELAEAAVAARVPIRILGKPYGTNDNYFRRFMAVVESAPQFVRYTGAVNDRRELAHIYQKARGFVLLSTMESLSLSALEAAAAGCPLLLSDLPWARCTFGDNATYYPISGTDATAHVLRNFYNHALELPAPPPPSRWKDVASQLLLIYNSLLNP
jgi:glycosyltransferase involved in cell wall biosynthesis